MHATAVARRETPLMRLIHAIPIIGTIARDIGRDVDNVFYALVILLTVVVLSVKTWGLAALTMIALGFVPVVMLTLVLLTRG